MSNAYTNYNQSVFINRTKLKGVTAVDGSFQIQTKPINILGLGSVNQVVADIPQANFSITRDIAFVDLFQKYTGLNESLLGSINYGNAVFGFNEGYLTSYSYSVEYAQTPISTLGITVYGDMGSGTTSAASIRFETGLNATGDVQDQVNKITRPSDITISCYGSETNRVKSFSFDVGIEKHAIYGLGNVNPVQVSTKYPLTVNTSFTIEVDNYNSRRITDYLTSLSGFDSFSINVKGIVYDPIGLEMNGQQIELPGGTEINFLGNNGYSVSQVWNFNSSNTKLISQDISSSAEDVTQVKLNYVTYLNAPRNSRFDTVAFPSVG